MPTRRTGRLRWILVLAVSGVVLAGTYRSLRGGSPESAGRPEVVRAERRDIATVITATGVVEARVGAEVRVGSRLSGVVRRLFVRIGDSVRRGQLLAELDDRDLGARVDEASAQVGRLEAEHRFAATELERARALRAGNNLTVADLDAAERNFAVAEQQLAAARAALAYARTQHEYARITAPIGGVVASVSTQEGETVAAAFAAPTFVTLIDLSRLEVRAYVDETDIGRVTAGQTARFTVDTYGDQEFEGRVVAVYPKAEIRDNVVNYLTVIAFTPPPDRIIRPSMTTTVRLDVSRRTGVVAIPLRAVRREGDRPFVFLVRGAALERRGVTTGARDDAWVEILGGIAAGDSVAVGPVATEEEPS
ncbi:MAG: efflux RND transporter periplasmic adaptor subunit [Gemmatimonadales bacterium]